MAYVDLVWMLTRKKREREKEAKTEGRYVQVTSKVIRQNLNTQLDDSKELLLLIIVTFVRYDVKSPFHLETSPDTGKMTQCLGFASKHSRKKRGGERLGEVI